MRKLITISIAFVSFLLGKVDAQSEEGQKAIANAVHYIETRGGDFLPDVQLMVYWLNRKYSLPLSAQWKEQVEAMVKNPVWNKTELRYYFRVVDPQFPMTLEELDEATGFNWLTARALYCDRFPVGRAFIDSLEVYNRGSYDCTHSAFALYWAREKECIQLGELGNFQQEVEDRLLEVVLEREAHTDVGIEAMAMLLQLGRRDLILPEWIEETLVQAQRPDGSWAEKITVDQSNDHTTALALWVLLEWNYPETPDLPWVDLSPER